ncbi:MAG: hypothetical protein KDA37_13600, partial [Planctomycetales bacterium]|nr:hypothetical protein [Planctomycetales bacterium]
MPTMLLPTKITVTGDATFTSGGSITLADTAPDVPAGKPGDELAVAGKASFLSAGAITIGSDGFLPAGNFTGGKFTAGLLNFNAPGVVTIEEDIATPTDPTPGSAIVMDNTAGTLVLTSAGNIVDGDPSLAGPPATSITVTGDATFNAVGLIKLANQDSDKLLVDGRASFAAGGDIDVGLEPVLTSFNAGQINFNTTQDVRIYEGSDTQIAGDNTAGTLRLTSAGSITDAAPTVSEPMGAEVSITQSATLNAPTADIVLGESAETFRFVSAQPFEEAKFLALQAVNVSIVAASNINLQTLSGVNASQFAGSFFLTAAGTIAQVGNGNDLGTLKADVVALNSTEGAVLFSGIELTRALDSANLQPNLSVHADGAVDFDDVFKPDAVDKRDQFPLAEIQGNSAGTTDGKYLPTSYDRNIRLDSPDLRRDGSRLEDLAGAKLKDEQAFRDVAAFQEPPPIDPDAPQPFYVSIVAVVLGDAVVGRVDDATSLVTSSNVSVLEDAGGGDAAPTATRFQAGIEVGSRTGNAFLQTNATGGDQSAPSDADSGAPAVTSLGAVELAEPGDIVFTSINNAPEEVVVHMQNGVFTAIAAGELSIDTTQPDRLKPLDATDKLRTTKLTTSTGTVTSVAAYQALLGVSENKVFQAFTADGPRFILDVPSELANAATTGLVRAATSDNGVLFEQRVTFAIGSRGEDGLIVEFEWADVQATRNANVDSLLVDRSTLFLTAFRPDQYAADVDGTIPNPEVAAAPVALNLVQPQSEVALLDMALLVQLNPDLQFRVVTVRHDFDPTFIPDNPVKPDLPTTIRVYNDPGINLYDHGGERSLNEAVNFVNPEARFVEPGFSEPSQLQAPEVIPPQEIQPAEVAEQVPADQPARFVPRQVIADFGDKIEFGLVDQKTDKWDTTVDQNGKRIW